MILRNIVNTVWHTILTLLCIVVIVLLWMSSRTITLVLYFLIVLVTIGNVSNYFAFKKLRIKSLQGREKGYIVTEGTIESIGTHAKNYFCESVELGWVTRFFYSDYLYDSISTVRTQGISILKTNSSNFIIDGADWSFEQRYPGVVHTKDSRSFIIIGGITDCIKVSHINEFPSEIESSIQELHLQERLKITAVWHALGYILNPSFSLPIMYRRQAVPYGRITLCGKVVDLDQPLNGITRKIVPAVNVMANNKNKYEDDNYVASLISSKNYDEVLHTFKMNILITVVWVIAGIVVTLWTFLK
jgi:hypothetical protein